MRTCLRLGALAAGLLVVSSLMPAAIYASPATTTVSVPTGPTTGGGLARSRPIVAVNPLPRITINSSGMANGVSGQTFVPRGANYVKLATSPKGDVFHSTFEPGLYDDIAAQKALAAMHAEGYNTVRVFIDAGGGGGDHGMGHGHGDMSPINTSYMANFGQFVKDATASGMYVVPAMDGVPSNDYYATQIAVADNNGGQYTPNIDGQNHWTMDQGFVAAKVEYMKQLITTLTAQIGAQYLTAILAWEPNNELYFEGDSAPFAKMTGTVTPLNGVTYDMSKPADRQQAADASLVEYSWRIKRAIQAVDPKGYMTIGFFLPAAVGKTTYNGFSVHCDCATSGNPKYWMPGRPAALSIFGAADIIDLHLYPSPESASYSEAGALSTAELSLFATRYFIGEYGATKASFGNNLSAAATVMRDDQVASCTIGNNKQGATGWLFWTWNSNSNLADISLNWNLQDGGGSGSGGGAIDRLLAPSARPNACAK